MRRLKLFVASLVFFVVACVFTIPSVEAYGASTHRFITREAAFLLEKKFKSGHDPEFTYYYNIDDLMKGAEEEDDPWSLFTRSKNHFLRPVDGSGWYDLSVEPGSKGKYANAYEWAIGNEYNWDLAVALAVNGYEWQTYEYLGHIVHLIQDCTVPAHTHLDTHPPIISDDYEKFCGTLTVDDNRFSRFYDYSKFSFPSTSTSQPIQKLKDLFYKAAWTSYNSNSFQAQKPPNSKGSWTGQLAKMFYIQFITVGAYQNWYIDDIGYLNQEWWESSEKPGYYYLENTGTDTSIPMVWKGKAGTKHLVEYFTDELIPTAVVYTSAVYKLFFETVEKTKQNRGSTLYVSTSGDDKFGLGTKDKPYAGLYRALDQSKSGNTINVSAGEYHSLVSAGAVNGARNIIGAGLGKTVIYCQHSQSPLITFGSGETNSSGSVKNITFIQEDDGASAISLNVTEKSVVVSNCEFIGLDVAIRTVNFSPLTVENCQFRSGGQAISLGAIQNSAPKISNNYFSGIFTGPVINIGIRDKPQIYNNVFNVGLEPARISRHDRIIDYPYSPSSTVNARGNWWLLSCDISPEDLVETKVDASQPLKSLPSKFQSFVAFEKLGDFNADCKINMEDFFLFSDKYLAICGSNGWNSRFDLDGSGKINWADFITFANNYGREFTGQSAKLAFADSAALVPFAPAAMLFPPYPNPVNSEVVISFVLSEPANISLKIYNILGQESRELFHGQAAGAQSVIWDTRDAQGQPVASGPYFFVLQTPNHRYARRVVIVR